MGARSALIAMRSSPLLLVLALALSGVGVQAKHPFPNPLEDPAGCGREGVSSSHVCDPEGLLSPEGSDRVDLMARALSSGGGPVVLVDPRSLHICGGINPSEAELEG